MKIEILDRGLRAAFLFLMAFAVGCGGGSAAGDASPPPAAWEYRVPDAGADGWAVGHAADASIGVGRLEAMMAAVGRGEFAYVDAIAVARAGRLVLDETVRTGVDAEDARVGNTDPRMHAQFSATKSIVALAVGIAIDKGYLPGTDSRFLDFFDYPAYANWDERKNDITLGHVLAMHSGLEWNEWDPPYSSPDNRLIRFYATETDYAKALLDLPMAADPGTTFAYNTAATVALAQAIENRAPLSFVDFGLNDLLLPLDIEAVEFLTTPTGLPNTGGGFYFRTRDMVKFGQLVLDGGTWRERRVVSGEWLDDMLTLRTRIAWPDPAAWDWQLDGYGYHWWLGHYEVDGTRFDTRVMWGFGGQWVVAVPALDLVVAVNSHGYDDSDAALNEAHTLLRRYLIPATLQ